MPVVSEVTTARLGWHDRSCHFSDDQSIEFFRRDITERLENRVGDDLLKLTLTGSLGLEAIGQLDSIIESLKSRLLRVKLYSTIKTAPTSAEIQSLTQRADDPVIAAVATALLSTADGDSEEAQVARLALRELYATCHSA